MTIKITIRTPDDHQLCQFKSGPILQELAMRWSYTVRHRNRWVTSPTDRNKIAADIRRDLRNLGILVKHLRKLATAELVEVSIPFVEESVGWEARVTPWEFLLSAATQKYRKRHSLKVVRHLNRKGGAVRAVKPKSLAIIEAAPGVLQQHFDFETERKLIQGTLHSLPCSYIENPSKVSLSDQLAEISPGMIHMTGIDTRLGNRLLGLREKGMDGIYLPHPVNELEIVEAEEIAKLLNSGKQKPAFVGFNCWDSGARIAPLVVAHGAGTALGFENTFDDSIAEIFFLHFYRACLANDWDYLAAFVAAWEGIAAYRHRIHGSGIILWSAKSLIANRAAGFPRGKESVQLAAKRGEAALPLATRRASPPDRINELVAVTVEVADSLNYASLHNQGGLLKNAGLFKSLLLRFLPQQSENSASEPNQPVGIVEDIEVKVHLNVGTDSFPFLSKVSIAAEDGVLDLATFDPEVVPLRNNPPGGIHVPLTSELARSVDERIQTTVLVEVRWHDQLLHQHTYPVWLNPVDEWKLNEQEIIWLPSFVQPRDPAVHKVIEKSQQYLRCLSDYSAAGFGGYQAFDSDARGLKQWDGVDEQVRAIWTSIAFETRLHYINPPPSYSENTQRLRSPHQTIEQGRGTCVDLAILLASCLEWIEIHPVIFMLDDHAFAGYWKSLAAFERFAVPFGLGEESAASRTSTGLERNEDAPRWVAPRDAYREIRRYVHEGSLVPLETVGLTSGDSFSEAKATALEYFENLRHRTFHSMVDIVRARASVTPLPLLLENHAKET